LAEALVSFAIAALLQLGSLEVNSSGFVRPPSAHVHLCQFLLYLQYSIYVP